MYHFPDLNSIHSWGDGGRMAGLRLCWARGLWLTSHRAMLANVYHRRLAKDYPHVAKIFSQPWPRQLQSKGASGCSMRQASIIHNGKHYKKNAWTTNGMGMSPKKYPVTSLTCHFPAPWRHLTQGSLSIVCRGYFHWQVSTVNKFLCPKRLNNSFHYSKLPVFLWDL